MPNFTANVRSTVRDVHGLVLSCARGDIEEDPANPGHVLRWKNRAPGVSSLPVIRDVGDPITYPGGRFSNPQQLVKARQPAIQLTGGGQKRVRFERANEQYLSFSIPGTFPQASGPWTVGYQFTKRPDTSNDQIIYDDQQSRVILRRRGSTGLGELKINAVTSQAPADHADGTFLGWSEGAGGIVWEKEATPYDTQAGTANAQVIIGTGLLGRGAGGAGTSLDGILDCFHLWPRRLSPLERDFVWSKLNEDAFSYAVEDRAAISLVRWTDRTGVLANAQIDRVRAVVGAEPKFKLATVPGLGASPYRVQIAAAVDGMVRPDTELGGDLFSLVWVETPGASPSYPAVVQDAGWSAVFDCQIEKAGHYCAAVKRPAGGIVMLHFDVEVVP